MLGSVGGIIALLGIIVLPITSGDTALRGLRLTVADTLGIKQDTNAKSLGLSFYGFYGVVPRRGEEVKKKTFSALRTPDSALTG